MAIVIPKFNIPRMYALRLKLFSRVFADRIGKICHEPELTDAVRDTQKVIPRAKRDAIMETLRVFAGEVFTEEMCTRLCWQIAGNVDKLSAGMPVRAWASQSDGEWMPIELLAVKPVRRFGLITNECRFQVLAGSACTLVITRHMSRPALKYVARKVGFSSTVGSYPYKHIADLLGLRLLGLFTPELVRDGRPSFREIACPSGFVKWNRDNYITVRTRKSPCPERFNHSCSRCSYGTDRCRYAIHPTTYVLGYCEECKNDSAAFNPEDTGPLCVSCVVKVGLRTTPVR